MTCREFADFMDDYLAGGLPADVLSPFEYHLSVCANCVRYLAQYRDTITMGRAAFARSADPVPAEVPEDLIAAIMQARHNR